MSFKCNETVINRLKLLAEMLEIAFITKNQLWVLFHSAKSISDHFGTSKKFGIFVSKILKFLYVSTPHTS